MKTKLIILISLFALTAFAQDEFYTKGLISGYAWTAPASASEVAFAKSESLYYLLIVRKTKTDLQRKVSFPLDCNDDMGEPITTDNSSTIELETIEKMIDEFYSTKENLIIPV